MSSNECVVQPESKSFFDGRSITKVQKRFLILAAWAYAFDQMDILIFSIVAPEFVKSYNWTLQQVANVSSAEIFGMFCGALFGGWLGDRIGRKRGLLTCIGIFSFSSIATMFFYHFPIVLTLRVITGVGTIGTVTIAMSYISEMMPSESRGKYQALTIAVGTMGVPICVLIARAITPLSPHAWRLLFLIGGLGALILLIGKSWLKESPRWLVSKGRIGEAEEVLHEINPDLKLPADADRLARTKDCGYKAAFQTLIDPLYLKRTLTLSIVVVGVTTGTLFLTLFYNTIHREMGFTRVIALNLMLAMSLLVPVGDVGVSFFSDRGGRKWPLVITFVLYGSLFIVQGWCTSVWAIGAILLIKGLFVSSTMTLTWTYLAESFPTHVRSSAVGIIFGSARVVAALSLLTVPVLYEAYGYKGINMINGLILIIPAIIVIVLGDKTANISLEHLNPPSDIDEIPAR